MPTQRAEDRIAGGTNNGSQGYREAEPPSEAAWQRDRQMPINLRISYRAREALGPSSFCYRESEFSRRPVDSLAIGW